MRPSRNERRRRKALATCVGAQHAVEARQHTEAEDHTSGGAFDLAPDGEIRNNGRMHGVPNVDHSGQKGERLAVRMRYLLSVHTADDMAAMARGSFNEARASEAMSTWTDLCSSLQRHSKAFDGGLVVTEEAMAVLDNMCDGMERLLFSMSDGSM